MTDQIWTASKFLSGSTSKKIPYEIVHCLNMTLKSWTQKNALITTALIQDKNFYFQGVSSDFYTLAKALCGVEFKNELVQIALPQIYQHRPLLNVALYHELGHFLDIAHGVINYSLLLIPSEQLSLPGIDFSAWSPEQQNEIAINHRCEYFADIFAASYLGKAYKDFLLAFAKDASISWTHPATDDRLALIDVFLEGKQNNIIDLFQKSLTNLGLRKLEIAFSVPDISEAFDNVRPYAIKDEKELHGIFEAGTTYLQQMLETPKCSWIEAGESTTERVISNLVEKSIRNSMIIDRWRA